MHWCDQRLAQDSCLVGTRDALDACFERMPLADLVQGWREAHTTDLRGRTPGCCAFLSYFDRVGHDSPERALRFLEAMAELEPNDDLFALPAEEKLLSQLVHFHGARIAREVQIAAMQRPRLRMLMGGIAWELHCGMVGNADARRRLLSVANEPAYRAWKLRFLSGAETIDFASLSLPELAEAWVAIKNRSNLDRIRDNQAHDLFDFEAELVCDPLGALDLVKAVLAIEDHPNLLAVLAAGLLEDLLPAEDGPVIDAVVTSADTDPRFRALLRGAWFTDLSPPVVARLVRASEA